MRSTFTSLRVERMEDRLAPAVIHVAALPAAPMGQLAAVSRSATAFFPPDAILGRVTEAHPAVQFWPGDFTCPM
jgi:hypothetical protein